MITLQQYYGKHHMVQGEINPELTAEMESNAADLLAKVNALLIRFGEERAVNSGWRPAAYNARVPGAAKKSKHMTCNAVDLDDPDGDLDAWCMENLNALREIGLWMEHPAATKGWCHLQRIPASWKGVPAPQVTVFYP